MDPGLVPHREAHRPQPGPIGTRGCPAHIPGDPGQDLCQPRGAYSLIRCSPNRQHRAEYYFHFTDEETKAQGSKVMLPEGHTAIGWQSPGVTDTPLSPLYRHFPRARSVPGRVLAAVGRACGETVTAHGGAHVLGLWRGEFSHSCSRAQHSPSGAGWMVAPHKDMPLEPVEVALCGQGSLQM